jgi:phosphoribosylformimino-5-aminoimidazole carboxamide ribotide isomerase
MQTLRLIGVLDVKSGAVVRAVGGRRSEYRPVQSRWTCSTKPVDVARALRAAYRLDTFYLADLDAIVDGTAPAVAMYQQIRQLGCALWVDAGLHEAAAAAPLAETGVEGIVSGLESLVGPEELQQMCRVYCERIVFSLDLSGGKPLGERSTWNAGDAYAIAAKAMEAGVRRMIVLDLARVGEGQGTGTEELCGRLVRMFPEGEIFVGGGMRDTLDLRRIQEAGVHGVLIASALHDGRIQPEDLNYLGTR